MELLAAAREVRERIGKLAELRPTVRQTAWQRVHGEYTARLAKVDAELAPLLKEVRASRRECELAIAERGEEIATLGERRDELLLRHHIGELTSEAFASATREVDSRVAAARREISSLEERLRELDLALPDLRKPSPTPAPSAPDAPTVKHAAVTAASDPAGDAAPHPSAGAGTATDTITFSGPLLIVSEHGEQKTIRLGFGSCVIGSGPGCDVRIVGRGILPEHATITFHHDHHVLSASAAVEHNGKAVTNALLVHGDVIRVAGVEITFVQVDALDASGRALEGDDAQRTWLTPRARMEDAAHSEPYVETRTVHFVAPVLVVRRAGLERKFKLDFGSRTIGTASGCDILVAADPGVLPRHAAVHFEKDHYVVVAADHVKLNGKPTSRSPLADGDVIEVGRTEISFQSLS